MRLRASLPGLRWGRHHLCGFPKKRHAHPVGGLLIVCSPLVFRELTGVAFPPGGLKDDLIMLVPVLHPLLTRSVKRIRRPADTGTLASPCQELATLAPSLDFVPIFGSP